MHTGAFDSRPVLVLLHHRQRQEVIDVFVLRPQGGWVWFNHPQLTWIPAKVLVGGKEDITVEDDEEKLVSFHRKQSPARCYYWTWVYSHRLGMEPAYAGSWHRNAFHSTHSTRSDDWN